MNRFVFFYKRQIVMILLGVLSVALTGCLKDGPDLIPADAVQLFEKNKFKGEYIEITGPREYPSLNQLPEVEQEWNARAKSIRVGSGLDVIVWNKEDFQGDSLFFEADSESEKLFFEIRSLRIQQPE